VRIHIDLEGEIIMPEYEANRVGPNTWRIGPAGPNCGQVVLGIVFVFILGFAVIYGLVDWLGKQAAYQQLQNTQADFYSAIQANPHYFTDLFNSYHLSISSPIDIGTQGNDEYFTITVTNGDSKDHTVVPVFVSKKGVQYDTSTGITATSDHSNVTDNLWTIPAKTTVHEKVVWYGMANTGSVTTRISLVDGYPAVDPRDVLSKISMDTSRSYVNYLGLFCNIIIRNNDSFSHIISSPGVVSATVHYQDYGESKTIVNGIDPSGSNSFQNPIPAHTSEAVSAVESPANFGISVEDANKVTSIQGVVLSLTLQDYDLDGFAGQFNLPMSIMTRSYDAPGCDYTK
jgi:hypothetical protein